MPRKDGRPRMPVKLGLDPLPWVDKEDGEGRWIRQAHPDGWTEFEPRDGYSKNEEDYYGS